MDRTTRTLLLLTLLLSACTPGGFSPETPPPSIATDVPPSSGEPSATFTIPISTTEVLPPAKLIATLSTPHIDQGPDGAVTPPVSNPGECAYQWAYQDLPDLSAELLKSMQALQPEAQASATAFGEDCVHADGSRTFIPMETDFNLTLQVSNLTDQTALGEWIVKIMQVIESIPPGQIVGPRPGRVSIVFESSGERQALHFYRDQYRALEPGLSNAEIYQALQALQ